MSELREDLDRALGAVNISPPPVERVLRDGRRLRIRRRAAVVAGALAVAAVIAGAPALSHSIAAPPAPATSHDPVITDRPGAAGSGIIGLGKIGQVNWQVRLQPDHLAGAKPGDVCTDSITYNTATNATCGSLPSVTDGHPADFGSMGDSINETTLGAVAADVTYFVLTLTDGQQLKLIPVTYAGHRYVAWGTSLAEPIKDVTAHLGTPNSDSGQTEFIVPWDVRGQMPDFGNVWYKPGQALPRAVSAVVGNGTVDGNSWSVTAYVGPWGTCLLGAKDIDSPYYSESTFCSRPDPHSTTVIGQAYGQKTDVFSFSAAPDVATVRVTFGDGTTINAKPVKVGNMRIVSVAVPAKVSFNWAAYDAAGQRVAP